jgi:galactonate dehydratase
MDKTSRSAGWPELGIDLQGRMPPAPIATGESLSTKQQFAELLSHNVVSILQPEPLSLGGIFAARKIAIPNFFIHETFDEFNDAWEKDIVANAVHVVDGYIETSDRPGLGVDFNIDEIQKHPYREGNHLPLFQPGWERRKGEKLT